MSSRTGTPEGSPIYPSPIVEPDMWFKEFRDKRRSKKDCTFPKVTGRKRALSLPRVNDKHAAPLLGKTAGQMHSLFFKLPAELRTAIYEKVVGEEIHIILAEAHEGKPEITSYRSLQWKKIGEYRWKFAPPDSGRSGVGVMGLLRSCRGVYSEMIDVLYSTPTFIFYNYSSILGFTCSILPQRYNVIRSLHVLQGEIHTPGWDSCDFPRNNDFSPIRNLTIYNPVFSPGYIAPDELSSFDLIAGVMCRMAALKELRLDLEDDGICAEAFLIGLRGLPEGKSEDDDTPVVEMLRKRALEGLKVKVKVQWMHGPPYEMTL